MAAKLLLPGNGGRYVSETFASTDTSSADTLDCSQCEQIAVQIEQVTAATGDIQMEMTLNGTLWSSVSSPISVATDGLIAQFGITTGPFMLMRINPTGITGGTVKVHIAGLW
jgi:hypothetical protein